VWQRRTTIAKCSKAGHTARAGRGTVGNRITTTIATGRDPQYVTTSKYADLRPKKKCCRSKPRCKRCPLVLHRVHKAELNGIRGKELEKVFKRARKH
jgi:hypothetical protein